MGRRGKKEWRWALLAPAVLWINIVSKKKIIIESMIRRTLPWMVSLIFPKGARCYHGMAASK